MINHLGNGWLYPLLGIAIMARIGWDSYHVILTATLAVGIAHVIYLFLKRAVARDRPFVRDPALSCLSRPLDRHSFPSGHCMTLTAVLVPLTMALPDTTAPTILLWFLLAWARLVSAHHYPSDIVAGALLGFLVTVPVSAVLLR
jgi:undecaprenyl-diphosphatase